VARGDHARKRQWHGVEFMEKSARRPAPGLLSSEQYADVVAEISARRALTNGLKEDGRRLFGYFETRDRHEANPAGYRWPNRGAAEDSGSSRWPPTMSNTVARVHRRSSRSLHRVGMAETQLALAPPRELATSGAGPLHLLDVRRSGIAEDLRAGRTTWTTNHLAGSCRLPRLSGVRDGVLPSFGTSQLRLLLPSRTSLSRGTMDNTVVLLDPPSPADVARSCISLMLSPPAWRAGLHPDRVRAAGEGLRPGPGVRVLQFAKGSADRRVSRSSSRQCGAAGRLASSAEYPLPRSASRPRFSTPPTCGRTTRPRSALDARERTGWRLLTIEEHSVRRALHHRRGDGLRAGLASSLDQVALPTRTVRSASPPSFTRGVLTRSYRRQRGAKALNLAMRCHRIFESHC